jgi:hypothetical protein
MIEEEERGKRDNAYVCFDVDLRTGEIGWAMAGAGILIWL